MDQEFIQKMKRNLELEKYEIRKRLGHFGQEDAHVKDDFHTDFPEFGNKDEDNATEVAEYMNNLSLEGNLESRIKEIDEALESIEKGTYGYCKNCQKEINPERLKINPAAKTCVQC
ncbi:MAG: TraR/DksA C4-type zinc finger protein [Patescibacteria group bacterium]|nr:TraR/DksA C4-type zinc finger protein [Patescibacteria group bacterium]